MSPGPPLGALLDASNPVTMSSISSVIVAWRRWRNSPRNSSRCSSMFRTAACIEASRLACSLASDVAAARYTELQRYCRTTAEKRRSASIVNMGRPREGQGRAARLCS